MLRPSVHSVYTCKEMREEGKGERIGGERWEGGEGNGGERGGEEKKE